MTGGGAAFVWQGGKLGFQRIYARFLASSNTCATGDVLVNTLTNSQMDAAVTTLADGNVAVVWANLTNSMKDVYVQRLSPVGQRLGGAILVNQFTAYNQRSPGIAALSDGRFVVVWISEQQQAENTADVYARIYSAAGIPAGNEFLVGNGVTNVCANPSVAAAADGGFVVAWMQKDLTVLDRKSTRLNSSH